MVTGDLFVKHYVTNFENYTLQLGTTTRYTYKCEIKTILVYHIEIQFVLNNYYN